MRCLEVLLDGKVICRAGDDSLSILTATLHLLPEIHMQRLIVSGQLEKDGLAKIQRWLDMSLLTGAEVALRVVDSSTAEPPLAVRNFGTFPGEHERKFFCSFCGASGAGGTPLMNGPAGNICRRCVNGFATWASAQSRDG